jgi:hypothetical protein
MAITWLGEYRSAPVMADNPNRTCTNNDDGVSWLDLAIEDTHLVGAVGRISAQHEDLLVAHLRSGTR